MSNMNGTGRIEISSNAGQSEYYNKSICITITGIGCKLSDAELQQLFDPFNMEQSNLIDIGPCIAQKIIEEHGSHLHVRQTKDGHTTRYNQKVWKEGAGGVSSWVTKPTGPKPGL
jgi:nitrogen fixation/metabolism regulation signal transduction histidine kinase